MNSPLQHIGEQKETSTSIDKYFSHLLVNEVFEWDIMLEKAYAMHTKSTQGITNWVSNVLKTKTKEVHQTPLICLCDQKAYYFADIYTILNNKIPILSLKNLKNLTTHETNLFTQLCCKLGIEKIEKKYGIGVLYYLWFSDFLSKQKKQELLTYIYQKTSTRMLYYLEWARHSAHRLGYKNISLEEQFRALYIFEELEKIDTHKNNITIQQVAPDTGAQIKGHRGAGRARGFEPLGYTGEKHPESAGKHCQIWLDAPMALGIFYNHNPLAVISGYIYNPNTFIITQMQKISYDHYDIHGRLIKKSIHTYFQKNDINRQEILFIELLTVLKKTSIQKIVIQSGANNERTKKTLEVIDLNHFGERISTKSTTTHLHAHIAKNIYDTFAEQQGFHKQKSGNREYTL